MCVCDFIDLTFTCWLKLNGFRPQSVCEVDQEIVGKSLSFGLKIIYYIIEKV